MTTIATKPRYSAKTSRSCTRGFWLGMLAGLALGSLPGGQPAMAQSSATPDPSACQLYFFGYKSVYEAATFVTPPPFDLPVKLGAHVSDVGLHTCPGVLHAPDPLAGNASLTVDLPGATSLEPDPENPLDNDPACYASVRQNFTQAQFKVSMFENMMPSGWGDLGDPAMVHLDTALDVRLYRSPDADDPDTPADESLVDAWETQIDSNGNSIVRIPIGRNRLTYRADSMMSIIDAFFVYVPGLPEGTGVIEKVIGGSQFLKDKLVLDFQRRTQLTAIKTPAGPRVPADVLLVDYRHGQLGLFDDIFVDAYQDVWVLDEVPPVISTETDISLLPGNRQPLLSYDEATGIFTMEAIHPGGMLANTGISIMRPLLVYRDRCGREVSLSHNGGGGALWETGSLINLDWTASDPGPRNAAGDVNTASLTHLIQIRDSFPPVLLAPPSIVREIPAGEPDQTVPVSLGVPRVFDLANLTPALSNDWSNPDGSNDEFGLGLTEVTWEASDGFNSSNAVQLVNIKIEGTNTPPVADSQQVDTLSFAETEIILTGSDGDYHPSVDRYDPLSFRIVEPPENGDFIAPLLPYFIDDVRLEASALRFQGDLRQENPALFCATATNGTAYQLEYPREPEWIGVSDEGVSMVHDSGSVICGNDSVGYTTRLVLFDAEQNLVAWQEFDDGGIRVEDIFWDRNTNLVYVARQGNEDIDRVDIYRNDLTHIAQYDLEAGPPADELEGPISVSVDNNGLMYVANSFQINVYRPLNRVPANPGTIVRLNGFEELLGIVWQRSPGYGEIESIATDSSNDLYISSSNRIVKLSAAEYAFPSTFSPGAELGWLGGCASNLTNTVACDTRAQKSLGYACTDALCGAPISGGEAGQLNRAQGIAIDPNDVLYVADSANLRVQRFTSDGAYGGEARSTGVGYGFLLGDFGYPTDIEVNSDHFYLLDRDADLLHSFETTPITPIDDGSASVTYRSADNFIGVDSFRFSATDGFDTSEADVTINVTRNFRPPEVPGDGSPISVPPVLEDTARAFTLPATDPDGGQDVLSVVITVPPQHGSVEVNGVQVTYTPDADYFGPDEFAYQVFDGTDTSEQTGIVAITVQPVPDPPVLDVETNADASLGFLTQHLFAVSDPDEGEQFTFTIDWGDGEVTTEGRFEQNGAPISPQDAVNPDGSLRDNVVATGPILGTLPNGTAASGAAHIFAASGVYTVSTCVTDQVELDPQTQVKTATGASQTVCNDSEVSVNLNPEILVDVESPTDEQAKDSSVDFPVRVRNLPFDLAADDPRYPMLPATGIDVFDLTVSGDFPSGFELLDVQSQDAMCSASGNRFSCSLATLPYASDAELMLSVRITEAAPGRAELGFAVRADWAGDTSPSIGSGKARVASSGAAPTIDLVMPDSAFAADHPEITLQGSGFEEGIRVFFGAVPAAPVRVIDSTTLTVQVPNAPPGVVDVTVINPDDQAAILANGWRYLAEAVAPPPPLPPPVLPRNGGGSVGGPALLLLLLMGAVLRHRSQRRLRQGRASLIPACHGGPS